MNFFSFLYLGRRGKEREGLAWLGKRVAGSVVGGERGI